MKKIIILAQFYFALLIGQNQSQIDSINFLLNQLPNNSQISVAFVNGENVSYYGAINQNGEIKQIDNHKSIFEIGSVTKVMTSTILANLVHERKIVLDDSLQKHVPFKLKRPEKNGKIVTIKMLSNHTSGLTRMPSNMWFDLLFNSKNPYKKYDLNRMEKYFKRKMKMDRIPGESALYSNIGVAFLGHVLGYIENMPYEVLLEKYVISKYGMSSTSLDRNKINENLVLGVNKNGDVVSNWDLNAFNPAGGVVSTVEDLSRFAQANFSDDPTLDLQRKKTGKYTEKIDMALGWLIFNEQGETVYWHNGGTGGYTSDMSINVNAEKSVIILSNVSAFVEETRKYRSLNFSLLSDIE